MNTNYRNFDLSIEHTEDGYFAHAFGEPFGEARDFFYSPFTPAEIDSFQRMLTEPATGEQSALQQATARALGERLFRTVFRHNLHSSLHSSYHLVYQERTQLRIRLQLSATPEFTQLPWEYLYEPARNEFFALSVHTPLVRHLALMHHILPLKVEPPLRVLVVMPSPGSYPRLNVEQNWLNLLDTLDHLALAGKMKWERLQKPTLLDLQRRLREGKYHILHFLGHAAFDEQTQEGSLVFEDEMGRGRLVSGEHLGALLRDHFSVRLALLEAGSTAPSGSRNPYIAVGQSLVRRGLPAVVTTQLALTPTLTSVFADALYTAIANYTPIDLAMTEVRRAMQAAEPSARWGAPVLCTRTADGQLFTEEVNKPAAPKRRIFAPR